MKGCHNPLEFCGNLQCFVSKNIDIYQKTLSSQLVKCVQKVDTSI